MTARKQQHGNGTKGNRDLNKVNFVSSHKRSDVDTNDKRQEKGQSPVPTPESPQSPRR